MNNPLLESALAYLALGCSVMPVHAGNNRDKDPHAGLLIRSGYTKIDPATNELRASWKPLQEELPTEQTLRQWFSCPQGVGLALVTGSRSGRIVVDFDGDEGRTFAEKLGLRPHVRTGGGYHHHFKSPPWRVGNLVGKNTEGAPDCIDIRGDGGNAILPPTQTRKGPYLQLRDSDDLDDLAILSIDLREALRLVPPVVSERPTIPLRLPRASGRYPSERILDWAIEGVQSGAKGGRNDVGYTLAWALYNNGYTHDEVEQIGRQYVSSVERQGAHAYTYAEFQASMRSAFAAGRGEPWGRDHSSPQIKPRNEREALEDVFHSLEPADQERATLLFVHEWLNKGQPLDEAITYLRLIKHPDAAKAARAAYLAHERGAVIGTLQGFLQGRRVRFGRGG